MTEQPIPVFRTIEDVPLIGTMAIYDSQTEVSEFVPYQWREFRSKHPALGRDSVFYGASPCTADQKIHYLTGVAQEGRDGSLSGEPLTLEAGEYAVVRVDDPPPFETHGSSYWEADCLRPVAGREERQSSRSLLVSQGRLADRPSRDLDSA